MRRETDAEMLKIFAEGLSEAATALKKAADSMERAKVPHVLLHTGSAFSSWGPKTVEFCHKSAADIRTQVLSFKSAQKSRAQIERERHEKYGKKPGSEPEP